jgi:hypothetical protein
MTIVKKEVLEVACRRMFYFMRDNPGKHHAYALIMELDLAGVKRGSDVRSVIHELRMTGIPICSSFHGYWIGQTDEEIQKCAGRLMKRGFRIIAAARAMIRVLTGQMSMEQIIDEAFPLGKEDADV